MIISLGEIQRLRLLQDRVGSFYVPPAILDGLLDMAEEWHRKKSSDILLDNESLRRIAAANPPPAEWYEGDGE